MQATNAVEVFDDTDTENAEQILTTTIGNQVFGMPVLTVQDILQPRHVAHVPQAPADVAGLINLRGRIATVIDLRHWLGFDTADIAKQMHIVIEHDGELYSFLVDTVGDVVPVNQDSVEGAPPNLSSEWRTISNTVLRHEGELILIVDVSVLIKALTAN